MRIEPIYHAVTQRVDKMKRAYFLASDERKFSQTFDMPLRHRLRLYRHGFMSRAAALYDITRPNAYLSDFARYIYTPEINGDWSVFLNNKLAFHYLLSDHEEHRANVYAVLQNGRAHPLRGSRKGAGEKTAGKNASDWVRDCLDREEKIVIKPITGGGGENICLCQDLGGRYTVNGTVYSPSEFEQLVNDLDEYLVSEFIEQAAYATEIYPSTPNTIRVLTMIDPVTDEPFIAMAVHRIGSDASGCLDNVEQGGFATEVDRETGSLSAAAQWQEGTLEWYRTHPDTDTRIADTQVPGWESIRARLLSIADELSYIPYIGWDILVTGPGEFRIIEGNDHSDVEFLQVHWPLLTDERVRRFYEAHGVIK